MADNSSIKFNRDQYNQWEKVRETGWKGEGNYAPFGQALVEGKQEPLPGVADMWDIWPDDPQFIGTDWQNPEPNFEALHDYEYEYLDSALLTNVEIGKCLGAGGFGSVYEVKADYRQSERPGVQWVQRRLACKVIRLKHSGKDEIIQSLQEMYSLRYLRHNNICNICEIIGIPDRITGFPYSAVCLFYELCDGTLGELIANHTPEDESEFFCHWAPPEHITKHWFAQVALGLDYLHSNLITHEDMSENNILYRKKSELSTGEGDLEDDFFSSIFKISDFGTSSVHYEDTTNDFLIGQKEDITKLGDLLFNFGIPGNLALDLRSQFLDVCRLKEAGICDDDNRQKWKSISKLIKKLFSKLEDNKTTPLSPTNLSVRQILKDKWLQNDIDPRTEPYILREPTEENKPSTPKRKPEVPEDKKRKKLSKTNKFKNLKKIRFKKFKVLTKE